MAHEIEMVDGKASMAFWGLTPWHNLGVSVDKAMTSKEAITAAQLDWSVEKYPVLAQVMDQKTKQMVLSESKEYFSVVRSRDHKILGVVESQYTPVQNEECFSFMDDICKPTGDIRFHTAGSLYGGKRVFMLAKLENIRTEPVKGDISESYLLLSNSHDGSSHLRCFFTSIRVVCANTLRLATNSGKGEGISIKHVGAMATKKKIAQDLLGLATEEFAEYQKMAKYLASLRVDANYFEDFIDYLLPLDPEKDNNRRENNRDKIQDLFENGRGTQIKGVAGTRWGLLNAVTEYTNHHKSYRNTGGKSSNEEDNRAHSLMFGGSNAFAQRALDRLLVVA